MALLLEMVTLDNIEGGSLSVSHNSLTTLTSSCKGSCVYHPVISILCLYMVSPLVFKQT
jgi:hypothetical protein